MSKIAEQKALEAYPIKHIALPFCFSIPDLNEPYRKPYQESYDKAMQDFLEKAESFFIEKHAGMLTQFKIYMKNEM